MGLEDMLWLKNQSRQENVIYLVVWVILFATPLLSLYVRSVSDQSISFDWTEVFIVWRRFAVFLLLFLIHNFLLAPLLVYKQRRLLYFSIVAIILTVFVIYQCSIRPDRKRTMRQMPPPMELRDSRPSELSSSHSSTSDNHPPFAFRRHFPPPIIGERDILAVMILLLMFGANLGVKFYFRSRNDRKKLLELEKQNLEQQLVYLRYQINPHFFMNTLNNIHALVDIAPQKAQETILELSKMMRFVLYEGDKSGVSLSREFEFLRTYIKLMQLRYTDKVKISVDLPEEVPEKSIPPLMLISFIENAFKHGVSYQHASFIEVKASFDNDHLLFRCRNSKAEKPNEEKGGVGLANVRQRLDLLYDNHYTLVINDGAKEYNVELTIPLS
ncbi:MAG: histidine kinase [Prevotella sp.]|nr:histidine kinase [Prevotella sp.]